LLGRILMSALAVAPVTDAVIESGIGIVPVLQPLSLYVEVAVPRIVVTGVVSVALPLVTQGEVNATEIGVVVSTPFRYTGMLTLLVP
jgi:hypothetical protein